MDTTTVTSGSTDRTGPVLVAAVLADGTVDAGIRESLRRDARLLLLVPPGVAHSRVAHALHRSRVQAPGLHVAAVRSPTCRTACARPPRAPRRRTGGRHRRSPRRGCPAARGATGSRWNGPGDARHGPVDRRRRGRRPPSGRPAGAADCGSCGCGPIPPSIPGSCGPRRWTGRPRSTRACRTRRGGAWIHGGARATPRSSAGGPGTPRPTRSPCSPAVRVCWSSVTGTPVGRRPRRWWRWPVP